MHIIILDGLMMTSKAATYNYLEEVLRLPDYFGHNLDALADCLSEFSSDVIIILVNSAALIDNLGDYGKAMINVFIESSEDGYIFIKK